MLKSVRPHQPEALWGEGAKCSARKAATSLQDPCCESMLRRPQQCFLMRFAAPVPGERERQKDERRATLTTAKHDCFGRLRSMRTAVEVPINATESHHLPEAWCTPMASTLWRRSSQVPATASPQSSGHAPPPARRRAGRRRSPPRRRGWPRARRPGRRGSRLYRAPLGEGLSWEASREGGSCGGDRQSLGGP